MPAGTGSGVIAIDLFVPGLPVPQGSKRALPIRKKVDGELRIVGSRVVDDNPVSLERWRGDVREAARRAWAGKALLDGPVAIDLVFWLPRPKSHYFTGRRAGVIRPDAPKYQAVKPDRDKLDRAVLDALTAVVFTDDSRAADGRTRKLYADDGRIGVAVRVADLRDTFPI